MAPPVFFRVNSHDEFAKWRNSEKGYINDGDFVKRYFPGRHLVHDVKSR